MSRLEKKRSYLLLNPKVSSDQNAKRRRLMTVPDETRKQKSFSTRQERVLLDRLNKNIINELIKNPNLTSEAIARTVRSPLSTVQRRRTALEKSILTKTYNMDMSIFGWRIADLMIELEKGDLNAISENIIQNNSNNIMNASLRIGSPQVNMVAQVCYRSSKELHQILQGIKAHDKVGRVEWSEIVQITAKNNASTFQNILESS
ncbi:MAG: winged helix-turn-helix transcriptional regulator [Nitrososphaeraceae archaeon]